MKIDDGVPRLETRFEDTFVQGLQRREKRLMGVGPAGLFDSFSINRVRPVTRPQRGDSSEGTARRTEHATLPMILHPKYSAGDSLSYTLFKGGKPSRWMLRCENMARQTHAQNRIFPAAQGLWETED